jgi:hypothetical protein
LRQPKEVHNSSTSDIRRKIFFFHVHQRGESFQMHEYFSIKQQCKHFFHIKSLKCPIHSCLTTLTSQRFSWRWLGNDEKYFYQMATRSVLDAIIVGTLSFFNSSFFNLFVYDTTCNLIVNKSKKCLVPSRLSFLSSVCTDIRYDLERYKVILLLGGGISGCTLAAELASRGRRVALVTKETLGHGASYCSSASLYWFIL